MSGSTAHSAAGRDLLPETGSRSGTRVDGGALPATTPVPTTTDARAARGGRATRPGVILAIVLISQLMVVLDASIVNIALPDMAAALHLSPTGLSWVINAYTLTFGGLLLLGARAGDILGRRRVFATGIALFSAASLAGGFATTATELLAARAIQGVGAAIAAPASLAILMTLFPGTRERTRALGWFAAVSVGGAAIGLIAGGMLTEWASWRWVMFVNVPIGIALLVAIFLALPETKRNPGHVDIAGALTSTLGVSAVVYGLVRAASTSWTDPQTVASLAIGVILLTGFIFIEARATSPITPLRLFANRNRSASHVVRLLMVAGMFGMFFFLTQFVQEIFGYSPLKTGMAFLPLPVTLFVVSQLTARVLAPRFSGRTLMLVGLVLATLGLHQASLLDAHSTYPALVLPLVLFGIGAGLTFVPLTAMSLDGASPSDAGAASGLVNVSQQVGGAIGLAVLVTVFGHSASPDAGNLSSTAIRAAQESFVNGADRSLTVASALTAVAAILVAVLMRNPSRRSEAPAAADSVPDDAGAVAEAELVLID
jgi:EmrB/QacA subfamily drug resistance transporter